MKAFEGKRVLVTGGSAGIGRAIAAGFAGQGAKVVIAARTAKTLNEAAKDIGAIPIVCDLSSEDAAASLATATIETLGGLDVLVLSSGFHVAGNITELGSSAFADLLRTNVIGPSALARLLAPQLTATHGDILIVNSTVVRAQNIKGRTYFAAGQHAMKAFSDGLRDELNESGVRVTSIFPGTTATPRQKRMHDSSGKKYQPDRLLQPEDVASITLAALSMPATAEVTDIIVRPRFKS